MDVTKGDDVQSCFKQVEEVLESKNYQLWAIVNNAGIASPGETEWAESGSVDDFRTVMEINFFGVLRVTRAFVPLLRQSKGRIINMSSIAARTNLPGLNSYAVSKAATSKLTERTAVRTGQIRYHYSRH